MIQRVSYIRAFLAGYALAQVVSHISLQFSNVLPFTVFGVHMTPRANLGILIIWFLIFIFLVYPFFMQKRY